MGSLRRDLPWLYRLYRERFLDLAQKVSDEPVMAARDDRYGIVLNVPRCDSSATSTPTR